MPIDITHSRIRTVPTHISPCDNKQSIQNLAHTVLSRPLMLYARVYTQDGDYIGLYRKQDKTLLENDLKAFHGQGLKIAYMTDNQIETRLTVGSPK